ncbi:galactose-3-O-sulfotransferase 2-like [Lineus longissimus]|uniref:galactose-3-O-sulfotransferase 2-like n=1 Tax=Lineus longissimus TaxID=88925 RepID=UPI00315D0065
MKRKLVIALPRYDEGHIGWPKSFQPNQIYRYNDIRDGNLTVDIIPHHLIYNRTALEQVMSNDTVYISIVREPFSQFKSTLNYFQKAVLQLDMPGTQKEAVTQFLNNADEYEKNVTFTFNERPAGEKSITKNFMATEFGFPVSKFKDEKFIKDFLNKIDKEFHLVMLYEELYESVVLLRRLLCWDFKDILFTVVNKQYYRVDRVTDSVIYRRQQKWSAVDHALYYHLRKILQLRKSSQIYRPLMLEAQHLRRVTYKLKHFCDLEEGPYLEIKATTWHLDFKVRRSQCGLLNMYPHRLDEQLKKDLDMRLSKLGIEKFYNEDDDF